MNSEKEEVAAIEEARKLIQRMIVGGLEKTKIMTILEEALEFHFGSDFYITENLEAKQ